MRIPANMWDYQVGNLSSPSCFSPFGPFDIRTGGSSVTGKTYTWDNANGQWGAETDMPTARRNAFCARVKTAGGQEEVVVAGGYNGASRLNVVEIFNVVTGMWRTGKEREGQFASGSAALSKIWQIAKFPPNEAGASRA